jgi:hypothetical protein
MKYMKKNAHTKSHLSHLAKPKPLINLDAQLTRTAS